jgi:hypothetical protein
MKYLALLAAVAAFAVAPSASEAGKNKCQGKACKIQRKESCEKKEKEPKEPSFEKQFKEKICSPVCCGKKQKK